MWTIEDLWKVVGELYLQVKAQQRVIAELTTQLEAAKGTPPSGPGQNAVE